MKKKNLKTGKRAPELKRGKPVLVQRAVKRARRETGIMAVPHELRHSYATHCLNRGVNIKALSEAMGHAQIETTSRYCHAEPFSVGSPLDV